jgi:putative pyruvate formate lyase activating enzyme
MNSASPRPKTVPASLHGDGRFLWPHRDFEPVYLKTHRSGRLTEKVEAARELLRSCKVCPRVCEINRLENQTGVCKSGRHAQVASAFAHFGEEDCLRGWRGSGTIFFSRCNLKCVFCQNYETSQLGDGTEVTAEQLAGIMVQLHEAGCHNINFVTPEHVVPQILEALPLAIDAGLCLPIVYNTGGYDSLDSIRLLEGVVDVYMPDFKFWDPQHSAHYLLASDYPEAARQTVRAMHDQVGELKVDEEGLALRGVLIRHLVMPGLLEDTGEIMRWLASTLSRDTFVNLMDQYRPAWKARTDRRYADINRFLSEPEFEQAQALARTAGLWRFDSRWRRG